MFAHLSRKKVSQLHLPRKSNVTVEAIKLTAQLDQGQKSGNIKKVIKTNEKGQRANSKEDRSTHQRYLCQKSSFCQLNDRSIENDLQVSFGRRDRTRRQIQLAKDKDKTSRVCSSLKGKNERKDVPFVIDLGDRGKETRKPLLKMPLLGKVERALAERATTKERTLVIKITTQTFSVRQSALATKTHQESACKGRKKTRLGPKK